MKTPTKSKNHLAFIATGGLKEKCMRLTALAAMGLLLVALVPLPAGADFPGMNGRITFMRQDLHGFFQIWVANADFSLQRKITAGRANSGWSVWAPGGSRIAFDSDRTDPDPSDSPVINNIFTMKPDGSHLRKLMNSRGLNTDAAYSPDGLLIAFASDHGNVPGKQSIYVALAVDGSSMQRVTTVPKSPLFEFDLAPRFSPDGHSSSSPATELRKMWRKGRFLSSMSMGLI